MFDLFAAVDWSARSSPSASKPEKDAIFTALANKAGSKAPRYFRTRHQAYDALAALFDHALTDKKRLIIGFDASLGYPAGFAQAVTGTPHAFAVWQDLAKRICDDHENHNNRFEVANDINREFFGKGPFWGCPTGHHYQYLPPKASQREAAAVPFKDLRLTETITTGAQPCWKLYTTGSVGSQTLLCLPYLQKLRDVFAPHVAVWPFEPIATAQIVLVECYFRLIPILWPQENEIYDILDARQTYSFVEKLRGLSDEALTQLFSAAPNTPQVLEEGWTFGAGVWHIEPQKRANST